MDINASIVDQQLQGIIKKYPKFFSSSDEDKNISSAFVIYCMKARLGLPTQEVFDYCIDGGNDIGINGLYIGNVVDSEFNATLFQCKYKRNLLVNENFPESGVMTVIASVHELFDPSNRPVVNNKVIPKIEEIRSLIQDGYIPNIRVVLCNNGLKWNAISQSLIDKMEASYADKLVFEHFNHDSMLNILKRAKQIDTQIQVNGKIIVEDMKFVRALIGKISVRSIYELFDKHGDNLLQHNIRNYLGMHNSRINKDIRDTLCSDKSDNFYFYNNGITLVCDKLDYNAFQSSDYILNLKNVQIINGGQTCKTIYETFKHNPQSPISNSAYVMVRIYQLPENHDDFIQDITYSTNSQNPVYLRDLRSNDDLQKKLSLGIEGLGYTYIRQRGEYPLASEIITSSQVAESTMAIWRKKPHQARFMSREHFGKLYNEIFDNLNAAQAILGVLIFREVTTVCNDTQYSDNKSFMPYAAHYLSMMVGKYLLKSNFVTIAEVSHKNFLELRNDFFENAKKYISMSINDIERAINECYGNREISMAQLSATFRRGDLLQILQSNANMRDSIDSDREMESRNDALYHGEEMNEVHTADSSMEIDESLDTSSRD